jgi:hypothetical protein
VGAKNYLRNNNALQVALSEFASGTDLDHRP